MPEPLHLPPGSTQDLQLDIGRLPSGTRIYLQARLIRASAAGPTVLFTAGVHGDEVNGVEIVRRLLRSKLEERLEKGTVILMPLVNVYGFIHFSRDVPDGKDVNRSFPGSARGSLAARVAHTLSRNILPLADLAVDFHSGGGSLFNYPQVRYSRGHAESARLAEKFAPPVLVGARPIGKSFRKIALEQGIPMLVYEGGESTRLDGFAIQKGLQGAENLLSGLGMLPRGNAPLPTTHHFHRSTWQRAARSGIFIWSKSSGAEVGKGEPLGSLGDPAGKQLLPILAKRDGFLIGHNNAPVVSQGDALFHIAYEGE